MIDVRLIEGRRISDASTAIVSIVVFKTLLAATPITDQQQTHHNQPSRCQVEACACYWHMALRTAALVPVPSLGFCPRSYNGSLTLLVTLPTDSIVALRASNNCVNSGEVAAVVMICCMPLLLLLSADASHGTGNPRVPLALAPQITDHRSSQASHVGSTSNVAASYSPLLAHVRCQCSALYGKACWMHRDRHTGEFGLQYVASHSNSSRVTRQPHRITPVSRICNCNPAAKQRSRAAEQQSLSSRPAWRIANHLRRSSQHERNWPVARVLP